MIKGPLRKSAPVSQPEANPKSPLLLNTPFQRENPMSEIKPLVTAEAVKDALRSEDVRGALKQKVRQTFEAQIEADVDAILDTILGEPSGEQPPSQPEDVTSENGDIQPEPPVTDMTDTQPESGTML
ncbi:DUF826 domain-containing protein [Escherichia coli]|uniref:DUF826 domain-containing protein n=1 Tax=Escherichia coli TaxID=562 RepID=UPI00207B3B8F|nr:DUF826 domain-containing protein [Escherichia coli]